MNNKNLHPPLNSLVKIWRTDFGTGMAGNPIWKHAKYIRFENQNIFVEIGNKENGFIGEDVEKWILIN